MHNDPTQDGFRFFSLPDDDNPGNPGNLGHPGNPRNTGNPGKIKKRARALIYDAPQNKQLF